MNGTFLSRHCNALNKNGTIAVSGQTEFTELSYYCEGLYHHKDVLLILLSHEEYKTTNIVGLLTYLIPTPYFLKGNLMKLIFRKQKFPISLFRISPIV